MQKIFVDDDSIVEKRTCSWECRDVSNNYATQIVGFDFKKGKTFCKVYEKTNLKQDLGINADRINTACVADLNSQGKNYIESQYQSIVGNDSAKYNSNVQSSISYVQANNKISLSSFLASLVTLNPDIIDREKTSNSGEIALRDGLEFFLLQIYNKIVLVGLIFLLPKVLIMLKQCYIMHKMLMKILRHF